MASRERGHDNTGGEPMKDNLDMEAGGHSVHRIVGNFYLEEGNE